MAFQFGGIRQNEKLKSGFKKYNSLIYEHFVENTDYYLFLVNEVISKLYLILLIKDIEKSGIKSYIIVSSITVKDLEKADTEKLLSVESDWRKYLNFNQDCKCIIAFGDSVRVLNKSADVNFYDFLEDKFMSSRYWCGSEFIDGPDKWIYPTANVKELYPIQISNDPINMHTTFFRNQLKKVQLDDMSTNELDMRDYFIHEITED